jgi:hypothetical protein
VLAASGVWAQSRRAICCPQSLSVRGVSERGTRTTQGRQCVLQRRIQQRRRTSSQSTSHRCGYYFGTDRSSSPRSAGGRRACRLEGERGRRSAHRNDSSPGVQCALNMPPRAPRPAGGGGRGRLRARPRRPRSVASQRRIHADKLLRRVGERTDLRHTPFGDHLWIL